MRARTLLLIPAVCGAAAALSAPPEADSIEGIWVDSDQDALIQVSETDGEFTGKIVHLYSPLDEETGEPRRDELNPDPALRDRPVLGMTILEGFTFDGEDRWTGGRLYNPKSGKTYKGYMKLTDEGALKLRGYVLFSWFGRSTVWKRYEGDLEALEKDEGGVNDAGTSTEL